LIASPFLSGQPGFWFLAGAFISLILAIALVLLFVGREVSVQREKLRLERQRWSLLLATNQDAIFDLDFETGAVFFSPQWVGQFGYLPDELTPNRANWLERIHPDDRDGVEASLAGYLEQRAASYDIEYRLRHRAGHWCWIRAKAHAVWNEEGKAIRLVGSHTDITARKQAEAELEASEARLADASFPGLRTSEERYRELFERNPLPSWIYNTQDFKIQDVNEAAIAHYGWSREEFLGLTVFDIRLPGEAEALEAALARLASLERSGPWRHRRKDGSTIWVEIAVQDLRSGCAPLRLTLVHDITGRLEAAHAIKLAYAGLETLVEQRTSELREGELRWRALVESVPQIVWASGPSGEPDYLSPRAAEYTGLPLTELQNGKWLTEVHPADRSKAVGFWQAAAAAHSLYDVEFRIRSAGGEYRWFRNLGRPMRDANGQITRWIGTCTDIEDQKRSEGALEDAVARRTTELAEARNRAEKATLAKSQFLAAMSHEIRTPMNGVIGMANLMFDTELTSQQRCFMDAIRSSGEALLTVINDILDLSKIEAGRLALEQTQFDLSTLLDEAVEIVAAQAAAKGLTLSCKVDESVPFDFVGDPVRLRQIILNLLSNAVKFTADGSVSIHVTREATQNQLAILRFAIKDTGIGLTQVQQEGLFQAFQQADISTSRRFGGTGLGLAISKRLVEMMGGSIGLYSQLGEGSTFWFNVCIEAIAASRDVLSFEGSHVALVSKEPGAAAKICSYLERAGIRVSTYPHIPRSGQKRFDLLLVDSSAVAQSPEAAALLQASTAPVAILGSRADFKFMIAQIRTVAAFIEKPVRRLPLLRSIQDVFEDKHLNRPAYTENGAGPKVQRAHVLLAEDNKVNQLVARLLLEKLHCRVDIVEDGVAACSAVQRQVYDLVLMDCQMPTMSGFEAAQRIRAFESGGRRTPILALTAGVLQEERERCYACGMDDFLSKPISGKALEDALDRWTPLPAAA
jgi:PAS domain S-box-containing protein